MSDIIQSPIKKIWLGSSYDEVKSRCSIVAEALGLNYNSEIGLFYKDDESYGFRWVIEDWRVCRFFLYANGADCGNVSYPILGQYYGSNFYFDYYILPSGGVIFGVNTSNSSYIINTGAIDCYDINDTENHAWSFFTVGQYEGFRITCPSFLTGASSYLRSDYKIETSPFYFFTYPILIDEDNINKNIVLASDDVRLLRTYWSDLTTKVITLNNKKYIISARHQATYSPFIVEIRE